MPTPPERSGPFWDAVDGRAPLPPVAELLGWQLEDVDPAAGTIRVRFHARPEFRNPLGNIQGGMLAAMLDDTMGPALVATLPPGRFAPTLEMKVSYLAPAKVGPLWGHGRVVQAGRTIAFVEGELPRPAPWSHARPPPLASSTCSSQVDPRDRPARG